jgi:hypothetical protein
MNLNGDEQISEDDVKKITDSITEKLQKDVEKQEAISRKLVVCWYCEEIAKNLNKENLILDEKIRSALLSGWVNYIAEHLCLDYRLYSINLPLF